MRGINSHDLDVGAGGVCERPEHVEDSSNAHLLAGKGHVLHRLVKERRMEEANSNLIDAPTDCLGLQLDFHTQRFDHIRTPTLRRNGAIAMFCYSYVTACHDKCGGG